MKFDTIIIGGGLSGMMAGITLARNGQKCLMVSAGQSALHFFNGSLEIMRSEGNPTGAIAALPTNHPYSKIGYERLNAYIQEAQSLFAEMGITFAGNNLTNHYRVTPVGLLKPAWLTLEEYVRGSEVGLIEHWSKVALVNIKGYLDFNTTFIASNLDRQGIQAVEVEVSTPELHNLRTNPSEMRSTNIAKTLVGDALKAFAEQVNASCPADAEVYLLPAVFGINSDEEVKALKAALNKPAYFIATMPPSVPGIRLQTALRRKFQALGGTFMLGDSVVSGRFENGRLLSVRTENHGDMDFKADNFVLATGNFMTHGLTSDRHGVYEAALGLDVDYLADRKEWTKSNIFQEQPYMTFGVATDENLRAKKDGKVIENVYATGSVLSGFNGIKEGSATGISVVTGLYAAHQITK